MKEYIKKNKFNIFIMAIYMTITFIIMLYHESWRDEAQSWSIARNLNFIDIIKQMKYEGHPALWYLLLAPFAKIGLPYITIKIISWAITNISVFLILKKAPFNNIFKMLILFSMPLLYFFPAISRSYCLIPLAIGLIAITYENRKEKPIRYVLSIALLANTHVIMLGLVGMLLLIFYIEQILNRRENTKEQNKNIIISFIIIMILLILTAIPIASSIGVNTDISSDFSITAERFDIFLRQIENNIHYLFGNKFDVIVIAIIILLLLYELKYYPVNAIAIILSIGFQILIYTFIYSTSFQRAGTMIFIVLLFTWIQKPKKKIDKTEKKVVEYLTGILLILNLIYGIKQINIELTQNYSNAKQTATYIKENIIDGKFICPNIAYASALVPYINQDNMFWNPQSEKYFTYVTWDENYIQKYSLDELKQKLNKNFKEDEKLYLININWNEELLEKLQNEGELTKIYKAENSIRREDYEIYSINKEFRKTN